MDAILAAMSSVWFLVVWGAATVPCLAIVAQDLWTRNRELGTLMKIVWLLTVAYSGPLGLFLYFYSGRRQISTDNIWRKGARSVAHCYSGCGLGEIIGLLVAVTLISSKQGWIAAVTFTCAYLMGLALTVGPLVQDGVPMSSAFKDGVISESASIIVMEVVAILVDLWLSGQAKMSEPLFWSSMIVSLTLGLLAAYPVNVLLIHKGIKEGMHDPRHAAHGHG